MRSLVLAILLMSSFGFAQAQETPPDLDGYVTSVTSTSDFAVDGIHVVCVGVYGDMMPIPPNHY
jgi:hypothetical protein